MVKSGKSVIKFKELAQFQISNFHGRGYCSLFLGSRRMRYSFILRDNRIILRNITAKFHKPNDSGPNRRKHVRFEKEATFLEKNPRVQKNDVATQYERCVRRLEVDKAVNTDPSYETTLEEVVRIQNLNGNCSSCKINRRKKRKQNNQFKTNALHRAESIENQLIAQNSFLQQLIKLFDSANKIDQYTSTVLDDTVAEYPNCNLGHAVTNTQSIASLRQDEPAVKRMSEQENTDKISVWRKMFCCYS